MPRGRTKVLAECWRVAKENEAVWALIAVIAMTVAMELYQCL